MMENKTADAELVEESASDDNDPVRRMNECFARMVELVNPKPDYKLSMRYWAEEFARASKRVAKK
jgi:hypothetical protein